MAHGDASTSDRHRLTLRSHHSPALATTITIQCTLTDGDRQRLQSVLCDPLLESSSWDAPIGPLQLDIGLIPGVTDTAAEQVIHAASLLGIHVTDAAVGRLIDLNQALSDREIRSHYTNAVIERWATGINVEPGYAVRETTVPPTELVDLALDDQALGRLSSQRGLALDLAELHVIRDHFNAANRLPTDAELETLARPGASTVPTRAFGPTSCYPMARFSSRYSINFDAQPTRSMPALWCRRSMATQASCSSRLPAPTR